MKYHTVKYSLALMRKGVLTNATTWMESDYSLHDKESRKTNAIDFFFHEILRGVKFLLRDSTG